MRTMCGTILVAVVAAAGSLSAATPPAEAADAVVENGVFRLVIGGDAAAKSLVVKATGGLIMIVR